MMIYFGLAILIGLAIIIVVVNKTSMSVDIVLAGDIEKENDIIFKNKVTIFDFFFCGGKIINPAKYKVLMVGGNSMSKRGIEKRDLIFVKKFNGAVTEIDNLKSGDIILLKIHNGGPNDGKLKIREFAHTIDSTTIQTMSYENGQPKFSRPHSKSNVIGKVKYKMKY